MLLPSLRKPSAESLRRFLAEQEKLSYTYAAVGATAQQPPPGYVVDHTRVRLGEGEHVFHVAQAAIRRWEHFRLGWIETWPPDVAIQAGKVVVIMGRAAGFWMRNACRIVYAVDEAGPVSRFGFAYGTLPGHIESGEERFLVEWDRRENSVWYDILAFSKPRHILARLGYPFIRRAQKRFARDSAASMVKACRIA